MFKKYRKGIMEITTLTFLVTFLGTGFYNLVKFVGNTKVQSNLNKEQYAELQNYRDTLVTICNKPNLSPDVELICRQVFVPKK